MKWRTFFNLRQLGLLVLMGLAPSGIFSQPGYTFSSTRNLEKNEEYVTVRKSTGGQWNMTLPYRKADMKNGGEFSFHVARDREDVFSISYNWGGGRYFHEDFFYFKEIDGVPHLYMEIDNVEERNWEDGSERWRIIRAMDPVPITQVNPEVFTRDDSMERSWYEYDFFPGGTKCVIRLDHERANRKVVIKGPDGAEVARMKLLEDDDSGQCFMVGSWVKVDGSKFSVIQNMSFGWIINSIRLNFRYAGDYDFILESMRVEYTDRRDPDLEIPDGIFVPKKKIRFSELKEEMYTGEGIEEYFYSTRQE